ncbi:MAG: sugar phosphate isomerase/epimerase family protein [Bacteroidota bacterium]
MKMGFLTNSLVWAGIKDLRAIAAWAIANGFADLEVGPATPLDEAVFGRILDEGKIAISALIYCRNFLCESEQEAAEHQGQLRRRIQFAARMGIEKIVCSTGVLPASCKGMSFDPEASLDRVIEFLKRMVDLAERHGVKLAVENCPMMGNIAVSPFIWDKMFAAIGSKSLGLTYDPSHLVWQFIDPYENILRFRERIFHVHGKDTEILAPKLRELGVLHNNKWWRHRLPGLGDLDWNRIVANLYEIGYDGTISIEHEDPVWEGTEAKVKAGLLRSRDHIQQFLMP